MSFEFDKFVDDIDKRSKKYLEEKHSPKDVIEEDERRRRRSELYRERWQNQIKWESSNEQ